MMKMKEKLLETRKELDRIIRKSKSRIKNAPQGTLTISMKRGQPQFYLNRIEEGKRKKIYLRKEDDFRISALAQKAFDNKVINAAEKQKQCIEAFLKDYNENALKDIYIALSPIRRTLIDADILDDEEYARKWMEVSYEQERFNLGAGEYYTLKGERVRSKSEKIIADTLFNNGIPYRYEYPLRLKDGRIWRPDFTILNMRTREEFIYEHFGMMDDPDYCANALGKLHIYMENGFYLGEKLLITAESSVRPFSTKDLDLLIEHYLK